MTDTAPGRSKSVADPAAIAASLSEAQRAAILRAEMDGHRGRLFVRWWHANGRTLRSLTRRGISSVVWSGVMLTTLGDAVRAELERKSDASQG